MPADISSLLRDLAPESTALYEVLDRLDDDAWEVPTPAAGWTVRDQVTHLAWFDDAAVTPVPAQPVDRPGAGRPVRSWIRDGYSNCTAAGTVMLPGAVEGSGAVATSSG